ncbi:hypothetical protein ACT3SZ_14545 [Corynebacterium sp. AOP40-9SA-29]|uniref:hypothetical protein n=1 Tax=Corynebacterium sp. AOP40-9SA-29 TaxID=3457677 RepID=UPI004033E1EE
MTQRPRHPVKELEEVIRTAERQGWSVEKRKYFKMKCPCPDKHMKTVHLTPSDPNYLRNLTGQLKRSTCWKEEA